MKNPLRRPAAPPAGVTVEPLDVEGLYAVARRLSEGGRRRSAVYRRDHWRVTYGGSLWDDRIGDPRCIGLEVELLHDARSKTVDDAWLNRKCEAVQAVALAVALATDPYEVDRVAGP